MRILIIGGSIFLGKHLVLSALERQHEVVIFNRGNHHIDFEELSKNAK